MHGGLLTSGSARRDSGWGSPGPAGTDVGIGNDACFDVDGEHVRLLAAAVAPRVVELTASIFDRTTTHESHLLGQVTSCLGVGLAACTHDRPFSEGERRELQRIGRTIARSGGRPPTLVGVHSVLLIGHNEVLRSCEDSPTAARFAQQLQGGAKRLLEISEEMAAYIEEGYTKERFTRNGEVDRNRPIDALCALITEPTSLWRRPYLARMVEESGLDAMFPAVMAIAAGRVGEETEPTAVPIGRGGRLILAPIDEPEPHTLILCPSDSAGKFMAWLRRNLASTAVYTRAVTFDEAPTRYTSTRDILSFAKLVEGERIVDARKLLWHRMLANQRIELVRDYTEEVIGPILRLPENQRIALLKTLESLDRHGGSVRDAATALNVHEKTVRYRVGRIESLTGLNALARTHWPQLHRAVQLQAMFPGVVPAQRQAS
jgi:hypothetical protein